MKTLFLKLFEPILATFVASLHAVSSASTTSRQTLNFRTAFKGWDSVFDKLFRGLAEKASAERRTRLRNPAPFPSNTTHSLDASAIGNE
jgi:signal recognition particle receptor subunit alpha